MLGLELFFFLFFLALFLIAAIYSVGCNTQVQMMTVLVAAASRSWQTFALYCSDRSDLYEPKRVYILCKCARCKRR